MSDFDLFRLSPEHDMLRESVRAVCEDKIAPLAAEVDESGEFPQASYDALRKADFHAVHIPEAYGGAGADALATVIVIEEVARVCASSSLIPAVNKLGTMPLLLSASEDVLKRYLPAVASGEAMFSYALSEPEAGSDAAAMRTRAVRDGDSYVLNGAKRWITNAGVSEYYTVLAVTDPDAGANGISAFVVEKSDEGFTFGAPEKKLGIKGSPTRELYFDNVPHPGRPDRSARRAPASRRRCAPSTTPASRSPRRRSASRRVRSTSPRRYAKERKQFGRPIAEFQGLQFMLADMAMKLEAARQLTYAAAASPSAATAT